MKKYCQMKFGLSQWILGLGLALLINSCNKDDNPSDSPLTPGSLSFSYAGSISGSYSATGLSPATGVIWEKQWAEGSRFSNYGKNWVLISANLPRLSQGSDIVEMHIPENGAGNFPLPSAFSTEDGILFKYQAPPPAEQLKFTFSAGTIVINTISKTRVQGTFSGTAKDFSGTQTITITNGVFDLPLKNQ